MNAIAPARNAAQTAPLPEHAPALAPASQATEEAIAAILSAREARPDNPAPRLTAAAISAATVECRRRLEGIESALARCADEPVVRAWLLTVVLMIGHPRDPNEGAARVAALAAGLAHLPRRSFTLASARAVAAAHRWFPSMAEFLEILEPQAEDLRAERRRLRAALDAMATTRPVARDAATECERAAVAAKARAAVAELRGAAMEAASPDAKPAHLSAGALAAQYERIASEGGVFADAARARLAALRRSLSGDAGR